MQKRTEYACVKAKPDMSSVVADKYKATFVATFEYSSVAMLASGR